MACYPFDTVRRRNMMTLGEAIMYKNSWDAFNQIIKNEGAKSLFKGFGAKILHTSAITVAFVGCRQFYFSSCPKILSFCLKPDQTCLKISGRPSEPENALEWATGLYLAA
ncbi:hypothetical protein L484_010326 [Morus notabilis]|uniref:ADP/ATP translocase n=1 Tax=Morus notabilis TaxID=981085 RepID=W9QNE2_9ROSA|nr:hypothetical protein L484_010326 [Morus notabilis]